MAVTQINLFWFVSDFAFFLKFFYIFFTVFYGSFNSSISYFALFSQNIQLFNRNIQNLSRFLSAIKSLRLPRGGQHTHQLLKQFDILLLFIHLSQQCFHQIRCLFVSFYVNPFCQFYILFILLLSFWYWGCHSKWRSQFELAGEQNYFSVCNPYFQILILR